MGAEQDRQLARIGEQMQQKITTHHQWTPLREYKAPLEVAQATTEDSVKVSKSVPLGSGFPAASQQQANGWAQHQKPGQTNASSEYPSHQHPAPCSRQNDQLDQLSAAAATLSIDRVSNFRSATEQDNDNENDTGDENEQEDDEGTEQVNNSTATRSSSEPLHGDESVSFESSIAPPGDGLSSPYNEQPTSSSQDQESESEVADEAAERNEQEAAEASEAETADRSALDEQQQQQREIIMAQAQSEAKAIKEQQEALLKQQQLQQQMLLRRHQNDLEINQNDPHSLGLLVGDKRRKIIGNNSGRQHHHHQLATATTTTRRLTPMAHQMDIQFSDQPDSSSSGQSNVQNQQQNPIHSQTNSDNYDDELGVDYSIRRPMISSATAPQLDEVLNVPRYTESDLVPAAQHHYGAHYGSLHGHHKGGGHYYQFAESHKKGQFDSGYKRGGKKFSISGHSSQHKSHAEGHVKWHGKKGKGMQYWDYKHKGHKKGGHYGGHY